MLGDTRLTPRMIREMWEREVRKNGETRSLELFAIDYTRACVCHEIAKVLEKITTKQKRESLIKELKEAQP